MATFTWTNPAAGGDWADANNWSGGVGVPGTGDVAFITAATGTITATAVGFGTATFASAAATVQLQPAADL